MRWSELPCLNPEEEAGHRAYFPENDAGKPKALPGDEAAAVAAATAVVDKLFRDAKRRACGAVLGAFRDAKKDGTGYDLDGICREAAFRVAKETGLLG